MTAFIHDNFLLGTKMARHLYHEVAAELPIIDYHCHLDPHELAADRRFDDIAQLWVTSDPYKHRAMRMAGVPEQGVTGDASVREKFNHWAATVPQTIGNPLHHWTALELKRYFGIDTPLSPASAAETWETCNARLQEPGWTARGLLEQRRVASVCTSDRLLDDLTAHTALARDGFVVRVLPSLRADDVVAVGSPEFLPWLQSLAKATGVGVTDLDGFKAAIVRRLDAFAQVGCRLADHGLDDFVYETVEEGTAARLFAQRVRGDALSPLELTRLRSNLLRFLGVEYARRNWILQLHLGAQRATSSRLRRLAGPAGGYATIGARVDVASLCRWCDELEDVGGLPRIIVYPLSPDDFVPLAVLSGSFAEDGVAGKLQLGPAWWFNDHASGMRAHFDAIANHSLLGNFIGMTTDSRSLLSMTRHEYFRRVLCAWLGEQAQAGVLPASDAELAPIVRALCFENARRMLAL